jgi:hypothetical protein
MLKKLMSMPFVAGARMADIATGQDRVNIDTTHEVEGSDPTQWADEFLKDPSKISPFASDARRQGEMSIGKPFPLGPDIGITLLARRDERTVDGRPRTVLEVEYSGAFEGPGRITIEQERSGKMTVRDEWNDVVNKSFLPTLAAENGHPMVAGLGFKGIGNRAAGRTTRLMADMAETMVTMPFKMMSAPFKMFLGD